MAHRPGAKRKKPAGKIKPPAVRKKPVIAKRHRGSIQPMHKRAPSPRPRAPEQELGRRDAIHAELGAQLASSRGDEQQERAAIAAAIEAFMQLAIANGLPATASAYEALCPEFFWEGDASNPPVYARVPDATHDEVGRWFQLIVEGVRAYDARVAAMG